LTYLRSTTLGCQDIGIRIFEFVANQLTQLLIIVYGKEKTGIVRGVVSFRVKGAPGA